MSHISDVCGGGDAGRPLVPGALRGYRTWRLFDRGADVPDGRLPLTSVSRRRVVWGRTLLARCEPFHPPDPAAPPLSDDEDDHPAPQDGCTCGIYGWYDPADTGMVSARVFGVVEASGRVLMGERGFRAERATIKAVVTRNRRAAAACEQAGIAVYKRRRHLLRDHPPEDLSSLLGPDHRPPPRAVMPPVPWTAGFDGIVFLAVWARAAIIAVALVTLPTAPGIVAALAAQVALVGLVFTRLRH
jgi:hypothetical protein